MYFAIDIDETIANIGPGFAQYYSQKHGLSLPSDLLQSGTIADMYYYISEYYPEVVDVVVSHYRDTEARRSVKEAYLHAAPIKGSIEALQALSELGEVHYYTARPESLRAVTDQWLYMHGYPDGERYLFANTRDKLPALIANAPRSTSVVLIDDNAGFLLNQVWPRVRAVHRENFGPRFTAIAYGDKPIDASRLDVSCYSYASWPEIDQHFSHARRAHHGLPTA